MKNLKKLVSVIVTVAMLISSFAVLTVGAAGEYGDVEATNSYYKAIKVLSGLGIVKGDDEGNFNPTNDIKRSEMVALVCRALGEEAVASSSAGASFDDVSADHWAAGYIAWGVAGGIVNGVGDNKFDPDASVKFQDAVVMVMRALGYERIANRDANGGYPTGYLKVASQYGVLAGANYAGEKAATREVVAQVIYNAMTTPIVEISFYAADPDDDEYAVYNGKNDTDLRTLLTWTNEIYKVKATVEATAKSDPTTLGKDVENPKATLYISDTYDYAWTDVLDGKKPNVDLDSPADGENDVLSLDVYAGASDVADYLGYIVEAYIAENDNGDWELLAVVVDAKATDEETITAVDPQAVVSGNVYEYYADENDLRKTKIELASTRTIYYNGTVLTSTSISGMGGEQAILRAANAITFMGGKNEPYDKIFVTDYVYRQVDSVKAANDYVKFTSGSLKLDAEERDDETFTYNLYDADGNAITLADVKEGDIFNIAAPVLDDEATVRLGEAPYMDIYVTSKSVTGTVSEKNGAKYVIDGVAYDVLTTVKVGDEGVFYLTIDDKIYDKDASSAIAKNYGFLIECGPDTAVVGATSYVLRMWTEDGSVANYTLAPTVKVTGYAQKLNNAGAPLYYTSDVDDTEITTPTAYPVMVESQNYKRTGTGIPQSVLETKIDGLVAPVNTVYNADPAVLAVNEKAAKAAAASQRFVTYKLNAAGEIAELVFAGSNATYDAITKAAVSGTFNSDLNTFAGADLDDNSKLFLAETTDTNVVVDGNTVKQFVVAEEDDIEVLSFANLDEEKSEDAVTFTFKNEEYLSAAVLATAPDLGIVKTHLAVVADTADTTDTDGMEVTSYTLLQGDQTITLKADYDKLSGSTGWAVGDIVQYAVNADNEIIEVRTVYDADAGANKLNDSEFNLGNLREKKVAFVAGITTELKSGAMTLSDDSNVVIKKAKLNETEGNTYALINTMAITRKQDVKALAIDDLYESYEGAYYLAVAVVNEDGRFEDVVQIKLDGIAGLVDDGTAGLDDDKTASAADLAAFFATV